MLSGVFKEKNPAVKVAHTVAVCILELYFSLNITPFHSLCLAHQQLLTPQLKRQSVARHGCRTVQHRWVGSGARERVQKGAPIRQTGGSRGGEALSQSSQVELDRWDGTVGISKGQDRRWFGQDVSESARFQIFDSLKFPKVRELSNCRGDFFVCVCRVNKSCGKLGFFFYVRTLISLHKTQVFYCV